MHHLIVPAMERQKKMKEKKEKKEQKENKCHDKERQPKTQDWHLVLEEHSIISVKEKNG